MAAETFAISTGFQNTASEILMMRTPELQHKFMPTQTDFLSKLYSHKKDENHAKE